jgi:hypothetical protein
MGPTFTLRVEIGGHLLAQMTPSTSTANTTPVTVASKGIERKVVVEHGFSLL